MRWLRAALAATLLAAGPAAAQPAEPPAESPAEPSAEPSADDWGEPAADDAGWGEDDPGFGGLGDLPPVPVAPPPPPRNASLTGFVRYDLGLWAERNDRRPFAKDRISLDLAFRYRSDAWRVVAEIHGEYDAAYLAERDRFDEPTLEVYEARILSGEQYVATGLGPVEITLGRQIVAWGEGDVLSPLDVVNPRDLREPGLADLDDLRLGVLATRVGWFDGPHRVEAMAVHEAYFGERPPPLGEFSPLRAYALGDPLVANLLGERTVEWRHDRDRFDPAATQAFARWVYKGPGLDVGLYGAWALDQQGVVRLPPIAALLEDRVALELHHDRYGLVGHSGATTLGDWIVKWEAAATLDRAYNTGDPDAGLTPDALGDGEATLFTGMVGLTYAGIADTTLALEAQAGVFADRPDDLLFPADAPAFSVRAVRQAMRQKLRLLATATVFGATAEHGWLLRAEATYALSDAGSLTAGYVHFGPGEEGEFGPFYGFDEHDRAFLRLRWDFDLY